METEERYTSFSDLLLVRLMNSSEHAAYSEIFRRYHTLLLSHAFKKLRDKELAKDIVQDLFTNLWYKREQVLPTNNLAPFLFVTLRNKIIDHYLHSEVESKYISFLAHHLQNNQTSPTDYPLREKQFANYIEKQIQSLPKKMREVFELSKVDHLSNTEIAERLNTTESNVSQHVNNAIRILRVKISSFLTIL